MSRFIGAIVLLLASPTVWACQCGERPDVQTVFSRAPVVITGRVVGRHPLVIRRAELAATLRDYAPALFPIDRVDIAVTRVFKGDVGRSFYISELGCCVCEYGFEVGESYLIFAHPHPELPGRWMASFCWPTKPESKAGGDIAWLGRPVRMFAVTRADERSLVRRALDSVHALATPIVRHSLRGPLIARDKRELLAWSSLSILLTISLFVVLLRAIRRRTGPPDSG